MKPLLILSALILVSFTGCSKSIVEPDIDFKAPKYVEEMPSREVEENNNLGSIYGQGDNPLFSDRKAMRVNDIVTIQIVESATASSTGTKALAKESETAMGPGVFTYGGGDKTMGNLNNNLNQYLGMGASWGSTSDFTGSGTTNRNENFQTNITARIVKILHNGNYFVSGRRELLINGEKQIMQISGVIRPDDIDPTNMISSTQIADAKILYKTEGDIDRSTNEGWAAKFLSAVWPF